MVNPVEFEQHPQGKYLQRYKGEKREIPTNEKKNVTH